MSNFIEKQLKLGHMPSQIKIEDISLLGKIAGKESTFYEADLVLKSSSDSSYSLYPLSLKLYQDGSYINTKSGGYSSFLAKYFNHFNGEQDQTVLNQSRDQLYNKFLQALLQAVGIKNNGYKGENFPDDLWQKKGLSFLPGELPSDLRKILKNYYHQQAKQLYFYLKKYFDMYRQLKPDPFARALSSLLGHSVKQIQHFYALVNYADPGRSHFIHPNYNNLRLISIAHPKEGNSYFLIHLEDLSSKLNLQLQVRVKPMSSFKEKAFKVNCSAKFY